MKDRQIYDFVLKHYNSLKQFLKEINNNYEIFEKNELYQKAIKMDLFQIGELVNHFSDELLMKINKKDVKGVIDIRNYIAHGYQIVNNNEVWTTLQNDLPKLIEQIEQLVA